MMRLASRPPISAATSTDALMVAASLRNAELRGDVFVAETDHRRLISVDQDAAERDQHDANRGVDRRVFVDQIGNLRTTDAIR